MKTIAIVGAGQMGSAMAIPAIENGHRVKLIGTPLDVAIIDHAAKTGYHKTLKRQLPEDIEYYQVEDLETALNGADILVGGVSSFGVDWFLKHVLQIIPESLPVLAVTKGMENMPDGRFISFPEFYKEKLPHRNLSLNAIGGPCTSYELADKNHSLVCFCGDDMNILRELKGVFKTSYYNISLSTDVLGVECAVALKNVYALGVALAIGLAEKRDGIGSIQHYNTQAALFGQSIREIRRILAIVGSSDENIYLSAGDLYVTIFGGRTRLIGTLLGRGLSFAKAMEELKGETLESIAIAKRTAIFIKGLLEKDKVRIEEFPLLLHIDDIISRGTPVNIPWDKFEFERDGRVLL